MTSDYLVFEMRDALHEALHGAVADTLGAQMIDEIAQIVDVAARQAPGAGGAGAVVVRDVCER